MSRTIKVWKTAGAAAVAAANNGKKKIVLNFAPFTNCISEINNTQIDNAKDIDIVLPMYDLIEYGDDYSKTSGSLWNYYRDEPCLNANYAIAGLLADNNNSALFKFKTKIAGRIKDHGTKINKIRVPLNY